MAHWVLASDWVRRGQQDEAARWYESAYRIWPHDYTLAMDWAGHLLRSGAPGRAAAVAEPATRLRPERPAAWQLWAVSLYRQGRFEEAARLGAVAPPAVRQSLWFAYTIAAAHEAAGAAERAGEWWERVRSPGRSVESWIALHEVARLQLARGETALARETVSYGLRAAAGDSIGLGLFSELQREVGDGR